MMYAGENMPLDVMGSFWYYRKVHQLICFLCVISIWFQILLSRFFLLFFFFFLMERTISISIGRPMPIRNILIEV